MSGKYLRLQGHSFEYQQGQYPELFLIREAVTISPITCYNMIMKNPANDPEFKKELDTLKRKYSIPKGEALKEMLSTEEGKKRHLFREKKWNAFKKKWNVLFLIGDKPVMRKK